MFTNTCKFLGLSAALILLAMAVGNSGAVGLAQSECTLTVSSSQSIQQAIDGAAKEAVICLAVGTFVENLTINKSLTLQGAGEHATIIDGNQNGRVVTVTSAGNAVKVTLSDITIQNGSAESGGGISNEPVFGTYPSPALTLAHVTISGNTASQVGGGIYNNATLTLADATISGNSAPQGGGVFNSFRGTATLTRVIIRENFAQHGGGIYNSGIMALSNVVIHGNSVPDTLETQGSAGGISNFGSVGFPDSGTMTLTNVTVSENSAFSVAGISNILGSMTLVNVTISGNRASHAIGAIFNGDQIGQGVAAMVLINVTISGNLSPQGSHAGIAHGATSAKSSMVLKNVILANNGDENCSNYQSKKINITSLGHNLSSDGTCAKFFKGPADLNDTDPKLDPDGLKDNGGFTQTIALLPGSLAIDAVPVGACKDQSNTPQPIAADQRGIARPQGKACDIGAFELTR